MQRHGQSSHVVAFLHSGASSFDQRIWTSCRHCIPVAPSPPPYHCCNAYIRNHICKAVGILSGRFKSPHGVDIKALAPTGCSLVKSDRLQAYNTLACTGRLVTGFHTYGRWLPTRCQARPVRANLKHICAATRQAHSYLQPVL